MKSPRGTKTEQVEAAVKAFSGTFTLYELECVCMGVGRDMVRKVRFSSWLPEIIIGTFYDASNFTIPAIVSPAMPFMTISAISSHEISPMLMITSLAPASFAYTGIKAAGCTTSEEPIGSWGRPRLIRLMTI